MVRKLRNLWANAPKHCAGSGARGVSWLPVRRDPDGHTDSKGSFLLKWKQMCPRVEASQVEAGEHLRTFNQLRASGCRRAPAMHRQTHPEVPSKSEYQCALLNEGVVRRVFFGLRLSGQMRLRRSKSYRGIGGARENGQKNSRLYGQNGLGKCIQGSRHYHHHAHGKMHEVNVLDNFSPSLVLSTSWIAGSSNSSACSASTRKAVFHYARRATRVSAAARRGPQQWPALRLERQWPSMAHRESGDEDFDVARDKSHLFRVVEPFM